MLLGLLAKIKCKTYTLPQEHQQVFLKIQHQLLVQLLSLEELV